MRYGIFSDIHSNLEAFEAVIKAYRKEKIDEYFCLGDIVGYGADPEECVSLTRDLVKASVAGNHDWAAAGSFPDESFNDEARAAVIWTGRRLSEAGKEYLRGLELVRGTPDFTCVHGSLDDPGDFNYLSDINDCSGTFSLLSLPVCFIGHTHVPLVFIKDEKGRISRSDPGRINIEPGKKYIVNAGSVGQPRDGIPGAAYCIFDTLRRSVEIKRAAYDVSSARQKIIDQGLPESLGNRLLTGN